MRRFLLAALLVALAAAPAAQASFPGRNGQIAFVRIRGDAAPELWVANANGSRAHRLVANSGFDYPLFPAWSPDGSRIAFTATTRGYAAVAVVGADGSGLSLVTPSSFGAGGTTWTPDGRIGYVHGGGTWCISVVGAADVMCKSGAFQSPRWSPDGTRLAYFTYSVLETSGMTVADELWIRDLATGSIARFTATPAGVADWSPDSARLLFVGRDENLYVANADGSAPRVVRSGVTNAVWSPDGRLILVAEHEAKGQASLWTIRADGGGARRLTSGAVDVFPAWQPLPR